MQIGITGTHSFKEVFARFLVSAAGWKVAHLDAVSLDCWVVIGRATEVQVQRFIVV